MLLTNPSQVEWSLLLLTQPFLVLRHAWILLAATPLFVDFHKQ